MSHAAIFWAVLALVLIGLETAAPGILLLWFGFAAAGVFLLVLGFGLSTPAQMMLFVLLSFISVAVYWKFFRKAGEQTDQPLLNRRQEQMLDRVFSLESAIVNGEGRIKAGDAFWPVRGPDLPQGAPVRVVGVEAGVLRVTPAS
ncbi:MAG: NfeD family protein [Arenimonas sp.]|jgi:membrane protein implicated in regulation of membrane protease activity|nr:NfeD family protein [Arenimonas sp.]